MSLDPVYELGHSGVNSGKVGSATAGTPAHNACQKPAAARVCLTGQRTAWVSLKSKTGYVKIQRDSSLSSQRKASPLIMLWNEILSLGSVHKAGTSPTVVISPHPAGILLSWGHTSTQHAGWYSTIASLAFTLAYNANFCLLQCSG